MATVIQAEETNQSALCDELRAFLESNGHPEHAQIQEIIQKVEEIKARIIGMTTGGEISAEGTFPPDKIQEVQQCLIELQAELQKVFKIHVSVAERWTALKMDQKIPEEAIKPAVTAVLSECQKRWSTMQ